MTTESGNVRRVLKTWGLPAAVMGASFAAAFNCGGGRKNASTPTTPAPGTAPATPPQSPNATSNNAAALAGDPELATTVVTVQMDDAVSSLNAGDGTTNAQAAALTAAADVARTRTCTESGNDANVEIDYSGQGTLAGKSISVSETATGKETRVWSNAAGPVACTTNNKFAKIDWSKVADVSGLTLADTTERGRSLSTTFTNAKGASVTRTVITTQAGTRGVVWATPAGATTTATTTKTVTSSVNYTYNLTRFNGTTVDLTAVHATLPTAPLVVTVTRDAAGVPLTHTIVSGTMTAAKASDFYVTNTFTNVAYNVATSNADPCVPVSGSIVTNIYASNSAADTATPLKTMTITFSPTGPTVNSDTTASDDLSGAINHHCDFVGGD